MTRAIARNGIIREKNTESPGRCTDETNEPATAAKGEGRNEKGKERKREWENMESGATEER